MSSRRRDAQILARAWSEDARAEALLVAQAPGPVEEIRADLERRHGRAADRTLGPWRLRLRALARQLDLADAVAAHRRADEAYWSLVLQWRPFITRKARYDEVRFHVAPGELQGLYCEIGYVVAIRMDPDVAAFGTYFNQWRRSVAPRAPETTSLVHAARRHGLNARISALSLDYVYTSADTGAESTLQDAIPVEPNGDLERLERADLFAAVRPRLSDLHRRYLEAFLECETMDEVGARFGVTKQRVSQVRVALVRQFHALAPGIG